MKVCRDLCDQISFGECEVTGGTIRPDHVIGLARGGLVPATILANSLGVRTVIGHGYHSYDDDTQMRDYRNPHGVMYQDGVIDLRKGLLGSNILIVDDLCDEGILGNTIDMIVAASKGELDINTAAKVATGCCISILKRTKK